MSEHFIKEIEIKNYKLFKDFKAKGFGRVNLIGGKNNVGKTAFMEACFLNMHSTNIKTFSGSCISIWNARNYVECDKDDEELKISELIEKFKNFEINVNSRMVKLSIDDNSGHVIYHISIGEQEYKIDKNDFSTKEDYIDTIEFLDSIGTHNDELTELYKAIQEYDKEDLLNDELKKFDKNIDKYKVIKNIPKIKLISSDKYIDINEFGDGVKQFISIISALYTCNDGLLFIDEIANGVHYTNLDQIWELILTISKEQNVQVFATTHSKECIESYARVAKNQKDNEIAFIEFGKNKQGQISSMIYPYEWFIDTIYQNQEVRGW